MDGVDEVVVVTLRDEVAVALPDDPVEHPRARLVVFVEDDLADRVRRLGPRQHEVTALEVRLHRGAGEHGVRRRPAELGGPEEPPADREEGDRRGDTVAGYGQRPSVVPRMNVLSAFTAGGPAIAWIMLAIAAAILEVTIPHFGVVFVSLAAGAAAGAAWFDAHLGAQLAVFVVVLGLSLALLRPRLLKHLDAPGVPSRTEAVVGRDGIVTEDIEATIGAGRVNVRGQDWAARAAEAIPAGTRIRVVGADGIVLEVKRA